MKIPGYAAAMGLAKKTTKEEVEQADEATAFERLKGAGGPRAAQNLPMGHAGKVTMKHVDASNASPQVKAAIKKAAPDIKSYGDRAAALNAAGIRREEVDIQEEPFETDGPFKNRSAVYRSKNVKTGATIQHTGSLKQQIKSTLGTHTKPNLPGANRTMEEVELDEGKMDHMSLSSLWHQHARHNYSSDQGYGHGEGSMKNGSHAATAIENHVRKHYGNKVADDMVSHSDHSVAHAEYAGPGEAEHHEKEAEKLRKKHGITGTLHGESYVREENEEKGENAEKHEERPKKPNAFTMKSKGTSEFAKSSSGGKTKETSTGRTHSSGDRY